MTEEMVEVLIKIASKRKTKDGCRIKITTPAGRYLDTLIVEKRMITEQLRDIVNTWILIQLIILRMGLELNF
ncbi:MAG: hypothetical protein ACLS20_06290 [Faecalimonas umbilicata]|jgi:hypothetical protein|uniref:hypothetical protein n=1 Tax=Faecalimonas umbilicata TaxID=1912855 RepID=UPI00206A2D10|nr:MAG TPA: hypothetical protein [Caudoviricetes sp.]